MSELDKVLDWIENNKKEVFPHDYVEVNDLVDFINELKNPPKKMVWQCKTASSPEWRTITDEEYELFQHLSRFEFQHVEI